MRVIDILEKTQPTIQQLANKGVNANDIVYVELYNDYYRMMKEQHQKKYIDIQLCTKYNISRSGLHKIIRRLNKKVENK